MPSPFAVSIELSVEERAQLEGGATPDQFASAGVALASRVGRGRGPNNTGIAQRLGVAVSSVRKWRNRFAEHRLYGLTDEPRPGRPRTISDEQVEERPSEVGRRLARRTAASYDPPMFVTFDGLDKPTLHEPEARWLRDRLTANAANPDAYQAALKIELAYTELGHVDLSDDELRACLEILSQPDAPAGSANKLRSLGKSIQRQLARHEPDDQS